MLKRIRISCHRQRITASVGVAPDARVYIVHTAVLVKKKPPDFGARVSTIRAPSIDP